MLFFDLSAADSPSDWTDKYGKSAGLEVSQDGLYHAGKEFYVFSSQCYPVRPDGKYLLQGEFRTPPGVVESPGLHFGLSYVDKNGKRIGGMEGCAVENTLTELTAPVKSGDRVLKVKDASRWKKQVSVVAFGAQADESDLPNREITSRIIHIEKNGEHWNVDLSRRFWKNYPAGTKVRQQTGAPYSYIATRPLTEKWVKFHASGIRPWKNAVGVRIVIFGPIGKPVSLVMKNIEFLEMK